MKANTQKNKEIGVLGPRQQSHASGTRFCAPRHMLRGLEHECRRLAPRNTLTFTWSMVLGACFLWDKVLFCDFLV